MLLLRIHYIAIFPISYRFFRSTCKRVQSYTSRVPRIRILGIRSDTPIMLCYVYDVFRISDKENFLVCLYYVYTYTDTYARSFLISIVSLNPRTRVMLKLRHGYFYNATIVKRHWYFIYVNKRQFCTPEISRQFYEREMLRV